MEDKRLPDLYPGWKTVEEIGSGTVSTVYRICQTYDGRTSHAALKVFTIPMNNGEIKALRSEGYDDRSIAQYCRDSLERIEKEYTILKAMEDHSNIVRCDDLVKFRHDDGLGWDVCVRMELLTPLQDYVGTKVMEEQVIQVGMDICRALVLFEERGIMHRNIKTDSILAADDGTFKLGDCRASRIMEAPAAGRWDSTYDFMAPEVCDGQPYDIRADICSLGLVLYWLLNEQKCPFEPIGDIEPTPWMKHNACSRRFAGEELPAPKTGNGELQAIVLKACAYDQKERYQSARDMLRALEALVSKRKASKTERAQAAGYDTRPAETYRRQNRSGRQAQPAQRNTPGIRAKKKALLLKCIWMLAAAALVLFSAVVVCYNAVHVWTDATCTQPAQCKVCGKQDGSPPGHAWTDATCIEPAVCRSCGMANGTALGHNWLEATCSVPAVCSICGETTGQTLEHRWLDATCTMPAVCSECAVTSGDALGHDWAEATFTEPAICMRCGAAGSSALSFDNISVEDEVAFIRGICNSIASDKTAGVYQKVTLRHGVDAYYNSDGQIVCAMVFRGVDGIGGRSSLYSRIYYYHEGKLIFAFYEGEDAHRLYFYQGLLMRWRYQGAGVENDAAINHDFTFSDEYLEFERLALAESESFLTNAADEVS